MNPTARPCPCCNFSQPGSGPGIGIRQSDMPSRVEPSSWGVPIAWLRLGLHPLTVRHHDDERTSMKFPFWLGSRSAGGGLTKCVSLMTLSSARQVITCSSTTPRRTSAPGGTPCARTWLLVLARGDQVVGKMRPCIIFVMSDEGAGSKP